jgi:hypothetical protein
MEFWKTIVLIVESKFPGLLHDYESKLLLILKMAQARAD